MSHDAAARWYAAGLRFGCTACGDCCSGEPGAVWVQPDEVAAMAAHLGMAVAAFEAEHVRQIGSRRSLMGRFDGDCALLGQQSRRCTVYPVRPSQCRSWPFWRANLRSPAAWQQVCTECPGAGRGRLHTAEAIARIETRDRR